jgi:hypothetical protein
MNQSQAQSLVQQVQSIQPTTIGIYENNVQVALTEFVPLIGPAYGAISAYETGLAISATGQVSGATTTGLEAFFFLLLTPIFWLEFSCYSLAVEESISILISIKARDLLTEEWKWLLGSMLFVASVLFVSARFEASLIDFLK